MAGCAVGVSDETHSWVIEKLELLGKRMGIVSASHLIEKVRELKEEWTVRWLAGRLKVHVRKLKGIQIKELKNFDGIPSRDLGHSQRQRLQTRRPRPLRLGFDTS